MAVIAEVGSDERVVRRRARFFEIAGQYVEVDDVFFAERGIADDRFEVHEWVMARGVLVRDGCSLCVVWFADYGVPAGR